MKKLIATIALIGGLAVLIGFLRTAKAESPGPSPSVYLPLTVGMQVANNAATNSALMKQILPGRGCSFVLSGNAASGNSGNVIAYFSPSTDGVNPNTTIVWSLTVAANGATQATGSTNWTASQLYGFNGMYCWFVTNTAGGTWTNIASAFVLPGN